MDCIWRWLRSAIMKPHPTQGRCHCARLIVVSTGCISHKTNVYPNTIHMHCRMSVSLHTHYSQQIQRYTEQLPVRTKTGVHAALFVWVNDWHFKRIAPNDIHHHTIKLSYLHTFSLFAAQQRYMTHLFALWLWLFHSIINHSASIEWGYVVIIAINYLDINQLSNPAMILSLELQEKLHMNWIAE